MTEQAQEPRRIRAGDTIKPRNPPPHARDQQWICAYADYTTGYLSWLGWPPGEMRIDECELVEACSDEEHRATLERCANMSGNDRRRTVCGLQLDELDGTVRFTPAPTFGLSAEHPDHPAALRMLASILARNRKVAESRYVFEQAVAMEEWQAKKAHTDALMAERARAAEASAPSDSAAPAEVEG